MNKHKKFTITGVVLLIAGTLICGISLAVLGFDVKALSTSNYVTNEYEITDSFENISINGDIEDISFLLSEDGRCRVVCYEDEKDLHHVRVETDTLTIDKDNKNKWQFAFEINMESPTITVYLPEETYGSLAIDSDTGDVTVPGDFSFESINIELDTGDIELSASSEGEAALTTDTGKINVHDMSAKNMTLRTDTGFTGVTGVTVSGRIDAKTATGITDISDVTCENLYSAGDTGNLYLTGVTASGEFHIDRDTGDVRFDGSDAGAIYVETDTGDVTGTLLSDKVFLTDTDTGRVDVPRTITGGRCEITTDTGDINISVP